jgi:hypothetical protein
MKRIGEFRWIVFALPLVAAGGLWLQKAWCDRVIEHAEARTLHDESATPETDGSPDETTGMYAVIWQAPFGPTPAPAADEPDDARADTDRSRPSDAFGGALVGVIASRGTHRAVFHTAEGVEVLAIGEAVVGATLMDITPSGVSLLHDGATVKLPLLEEKR